MTIGYGSAQELVKGRRGAARLHACDSCGQRADEWSYNGDDPDEITGTWKGRPARWSLNPDHYTPLCVPCHRAKDFRRERCSRGHDVSVVGRYANRKCKGCAREYRQRHRDEHAQYKRDRREITNQQEAARYRALSDDAKAQKVERARVRRANRAPEQIERDRTRAREYMRHRRARGTI